MDIIGSDSKEHQTCHMVKTKTKVYCLSHNTRNKVYPPAKFIAEMILFLTISTFQEANTH